MFRRTWAIAAGAVAVLAGALVIQPAAATDIPTGNATTECTAAGYDYGVKLDTGDVGTYVYDDIGPWEPDELPITLTVTIKADNTFTWEGANPPVGAVLVKAGQVYTILGGGVSGGGMPGNPNRISHLTFCYGEEPNDPDEELTVSKTVDTSYVRAHDWSLDKSVDPEHVWLYVPEAGPSSQTVDWKIVVGYEGYQDSAHTVSGTVTVENTGDAAAAVDSLVDTMTIDGMDTPVVLDCGAIDLSGPLVHILQPGESFSCTYSVAVGGQVTGSNRADAATLTGGLYSSPDVPIVWGGPATELDKTVNLSDVGDLGSRPDQSFSAPNGGEVTYWHTFEWADFGDENCGDHPYDNTATLTGDTVDLSDTATVTVHVQCHVFKGETAWAANAGPGTLPYNTKGGNWATYVQYPNTAPVEKVYNLYAGQTMPVGTATVTPIGGGMVTVTSDLTGAWEFAATTSNMKIQTYAKAPSGNP